MRNAGALGVPEGIPIDIQFTDALSGEDWSVVLETTERLFPGSVEVVELTVPGPEFLETERPVTVMVVVDPEGGVNECEEGNNADTQETTYGCDTK